MAPFARPDFHVDILLYPEGGQWTAHCLQFDLVEVADTFEEAEQRIEGVVRAHISWALEHDNMENLFSSAPADAWKRFFTSKRGESRLITISVSDDQLADFPVTLQEVTPQHISA